MKKIQFLDGLRGLASLIVVFNHFVLAFYLSLFSPGHLEHLKPGWETFLSGTPFNIFYNGNFAVTIFFVLSGFVLSYKFFLKGEYKIITESAVKRYVRLVLPVAVSVFLAYFLMKFSLFYNQQASGLAGSEWLGGFWNFTPSFLGALNQTFIGVFFTNVFTYNVTLWAIAYEFFGSFLVLGFLALFGKMKNRHWAYLIAVIFFFQTYYLAFILGVLLSDLIAHNESVINKYDKTKIARIALLIAGLYLGSFPSGREVSGTMYSVLQNNFLSNPSVFYHVIGAFFVVMVLLDSKIMQKFFSLRPFLFLGEISYAVYLLHFIILGSFTSFIFLKLAQYLQYSWSVAISFALSMCLIIPLSYLMSRYVDAEAVNLSRLLYNRVFKD